MENACRIAGNVVSRVNNADLFTRRGGFGFSCFIPVFDFVS
jgi:hypothetical protein